MHRPRSAKRRIRADSSSPGRLVGGPSTANEVALSTAPNNGMTDRVILSCRPGTNLAGRTDVRAPNCRARGAARRRNGVAFALCSMPAKLTRNAPGRTLPDSGACTSGTTDRIRASEPLARQRGSAAQLQRARAGLCGQLGAEGRWRRRSLVHGEHNLTHTLPRLQLRGGADFSSPP